MLLLSPVPMVRGFGALLVVGIVVALACALTAGFAALIRFSERRARRAAGAAAAARGRGGLVGGDRHERSRAMGVAGVGRPARRRGHGARWTSRSLRPRRVLMIGLAVAVLGWVADTQTEVISDVRELVPRDLQALKDVNELQEATGVSGEIDVTLTGEDLTDPEVIAWMTDFQRDVLERPRLRGRRDLRPGQRPARAVPGAVAARPVPVRARREQQESVRALLDAVPPYFSQAVITEDRTTATLAFGIRLMPLDRQKEVIDDIEDRLDPPAGVDAAVVGLPVLAAEANDTLADPLRRFLTLLAGLLLVFVVLLRGPALDARGRDPADPDRARDRVVGARPVPAADPAQPDVGGHGRARDRDLDRVQRAAVGALPRGAGREARSRTRRSTRRTPRPGRPCWPRASRRSWASPR